MKPRVTNKKLLAEREAKRQEGIAKRRATHKKYIKFWKEYYAKYIGSPNNSKVFRPLPFYCKTKRSRRGIKKV
jgi:sulfur relay (sulfurtransferase) DsrC/TusE family protein